MRTIRYTFSFAQPDNIDSRLELSTEVIIDDDDEAFNEGIKVKALFDQFLDGLTEAGG